jgi:hypothetical protein
MDTAWILTNSLLSGEFENQLPSATGSESSRGDYERTQNRHSSLVSTWPKEQLASGLGRSTGALSTTERSGVLKGREMSIYLVLNPGLERDVFIGRLVVGLRCCF